jgi:Putative beta-barrel porin-2, OmpL-like. bbp2
MMTTKHLLAGLATAASLGIAGGSAAHADPLSTPALGATLSANPNPLSITAGDLGKIYFSGQLTGIGLSQDHTVAGDKSSRVDLSNAQVEVQKTDGVFQFYIQAGAYSLPSLGTAYAKATDLPDLTYKWVPVAFVKLQPSANFNLMIGKLPTLIGAESTFSFQNMNIARGLLWNQEPAISRGVQANVTHGPWTVSLSLNDGFYSNRFTTGSTLISYALSKTDTLAFDASVQFHKTSKASFATPLAQNNGQVYNLMWTHADGPWVVQPYLQYTSVPKSASIGIPDSGSTFGGAVLAKYSLTPSFSLAGRAEYIDSSGDTSLLYGPKSRAWSLTFTPTWQIKAFFVRGELSYTKLDKAAPGAGFGSAGMDDSQTRAMLETGFLY